MHILINMTDVIKLVDEWQVYINSCTHWRHQGRVVMGQLWHSTD